MMNNPHAKTKLPEYRLNGNQFENRLIDVDIEWGWVYNLKHRN